MLEREWRLDPRYSNDRLAYRLSSACNPGVTRITDDFGNAVSTGYFGSQQRAVYTGQQ